MKLRDYVQLVAAIVVHALASTFKVSATYHVRRLGTNYKRTETRGVSVASFDSPLDALNYIRQVTPHGNQESLYFILAETRFAFRPIGAVEEDDTEAQIGSGEEGSGVGPGIHPAAPPASESGRVLPDFGEGEELLDAGAGSRDRE